MVVHYMKEPSVRIEQKLQIKCEADVEISHRLVWWQRKQGDKMLLIVSLWIDYIIINLGGSPLNESLRNVDQLTQLSVELEHTDHVMPANRKKAKCSFKKSQQNHQFTV